MAAKGRFVVRAASINLHVGGFGQPIQASSFVSAQTALRLALIEQLPVAGCIEIGRHPGGVTDVGCANRTTRIDRLDLDGARSFHAETVGEVPE